MKFLLLLLIALGVVWLLRGARRRGEPPAAAPRPLSTSDPKRESMVACAHCGVMLPSSEALPARRGDAVVLVCSEAHRAAAEKPPA